MIKVVQDSDYLDYIDRIEEGIENSNADLYEGLNNDVKFLNEVVQPFVIVSYLNGVDSCEVVAKLCQRLTTTEVDEDQYDEMTMDYTNEVL